MKVKIAISVMAALWLLFISSEIISQQINFLIPLAAYGKIITGNICHQSPQKLMSFGGASLLVCSRCAGIYTGGFFAALSLFFLSNFKSKKMFYLFYSASLLILVDVTASTFQIYQYQKSLAFFTGLFFGLIVGIFIFAQLIKGKYEG